MSAFAYAGSLAAADDRNTQVTSDAGALLAPAFDAQKARTVLSLRGLTLSFGGIKAVSDIDLDVFPGEIRAIIGPNGAGKSSLINLISGLYRPQRGTIAIDGQVFSAVPASRAAKLGIARTYQNLALFKGLTVFENIVTGARRRSAQRLSSKFLASALASRGAGLPRTRGYGDYRPASRSHSRSPRRHIAIWPAEARRTRARARRPTEASSPR